MGSNTPYFDGCLPIEVMAERGRETLRHGPMKPFGLTNAHRPTEKAYAVVQLRQDNALGTLFNMVGFQTKLKHGEQVRIFRIIPGLENAEFARLGGLHRNTFLNAPKLLDDTLRLQALCRVCVSPGRSPAARAMSNPPPSACSRAASRRPNGRANGPRRRRSPPRMAPSSTISPADTCLRSTPARVLPADERQFRPVPAAHGIAPKGADGKRLRGTDKAMAKKRMITARALHDLDRWLAHPLHEAAE